MDTPTHPFDTSADEPVWGCDTCAHILDKPNELPSVETITTCPVCLRRWRVMLARLRGWQPFDSERTQAVFERMVATFADGRNHTSEPDFQGFYAALAANRLLEREFGLAVLAALTRIVDRPSRRKRRQPLRPRPER
jgi:hypothetical protein